MVFLGTPRLSYRLMKIRTRPEAPGSQSVLLIGAGEEAAAFLRALSAERRPTLRVAGLLAPGVEPDGAADQQLPHPWGGVSDIRRVLDRMADRGALPTTLVVAEPKLTGSRLAFVLEEAQRRGIPVRQAPRPTELRDAGAIELRPVALEDLLNRAPVRLDRDGMARLVRGRRVLVTGAGGSIGSELARQVAALAPSELTLLDNGEYALWQIDLELGEAYPAISRQAVIADVRDGPRLHDVFTAARPELVFHAAGLKHVPMMEANPAEALLTNALGTRLVADAAARAGSAAMVLISTDKAVNPTSWMGASKRLAEIYCQALDSAERDAGGLRCVTVRFGNVLGSTGSVVPLFRRQLARGGPLTVHPPGHAALLHDRAGSGQPGVAGDRGGVGGGDRACRRHLRPGHGQAGQDRGHRPADHPFGRPAAGRGHPAALHRSAPGREAVRGTIPWAGAAGAHRTSRIADGDAPAARNLPRSATPLPRSPPPAGPDAWTRRTTRWQPWCPNSTTKMAAPAPNPKR